MAWGLLSVRAMTRRHSIALSALPFFSFLGLQACAVDPVAFDEDVAEVAIEIVTEDPDCTLDEFVTCDQDLDPSVDGLSTCMDDEDGVRGWATCLPRVMEGPEDCFDHELWDGSVCTADAVGSTPIVLRFGSAPVAYRQGGGDFDLTGHGMSVATDWPTAATPWLARDRNGNGSIDDGGELFGSATALAAGGLAAHGFQALAELDENGDGLVTAADAAYASLLVWADKNGDRVSQPEELTSLAKAGVTSLAVRHHIALRCDARANCGRERAAFTYVGANGTPRQGEAVDVHLPWR
ncbi:MAG: hypothetical protein AAF928_09100 [Myxococcota bacterium]